MQLSKSPRVIKDMDQRSKEITVQTLTHLAVPTAKPSQHQVQLKQALLAASRPQTNTNSKRETWRQLMTKKKFVLPGIVAGLAIVAVLAFSLLGTQHQTYAEQLTDQTLQSFSSLSPDDQAKLDKQMNGNATDELNAAKNAKDLQVLTYAEFLKLTPHPSTISVHTSDNGPGPDSLDSSSLKYLKYTDSDGATHIIGVNKNGLPTLIMIFRNNPDGSESGSVQVQSQDGSSLNTSGSVGSGSASSNSVTNIHTSNTSCQSVNGNTTCSSSDGSSPDCQTAGNGSVTCTSSSTQTTTSPSVTNGQ